MSSIADTYAKALINSCENEQDFFIFLEELQQMHKDLKSKEVKRFFISPAISLEQKKQVLTPCFKLFKFNNLISSFLFLLLDKKRWLELDLIIECLIHKAHQMKGIVLVEVESIKKMDLDLKQKLTKKLSQFFNKQIFLTEKQSSSNLIGGIKVCSKGLVFDDTLLFHLTQMENQIKRGSYENTSQ